MRESGEYRCEVDGVYAYAYSDDPAIGNLSPTLCSHLIAFRIVVRARRAGADGAFPSREFAVCATHRAIVEALDRTIRSVGGQPRLVSVTPAELGEEG